MISLKNVFWKYARTERPALADVSAEIGEGEFVAVMGENGAGKTTFCRLLNGLIPHSMAGGLLGTVTVDGIATGSSSVVRLSEKVGMAFDDPETQFFTARVFDEVAFALENMLLPKREIVEKTRWALDAAGLSEYDDYPPATLSGGQKQRLAIAAALAMANRVLVLDEPCSRLDPVCTREVLSFIRNLRADKRLTVVMATGSPEEAADFADRVCVLKNGRVLAFDTPGRVFSDGGLLAAAGIDSPEGPGFALRPGVPVAKTAPVLRAERLRYMFETNPVRPVLDGVDLAIGENEFVAILGRNGSGKTTLLKNIAGLLRPVQGCVFVRGKDAGKMSVAEIAGEVGCVMQDSDNQLFEQTVYDEVAFALKRDPLKWGGGEARGKVGEALETLGLTALRDAFPPALCKADRVKTVFAAVLAMGAKILLLDEPLAGQDSRGSRMIMEILAGLHGKGYTVVLVTHNIRVAAGYAERLVVMKSGRVHLDGDVSAVLARTDELAEAGILVEKTALPFQGTIPSGA